MGYPSNCYEKRFFLALKPKGGDFWANFKGYKNILIILSQSLVYIGYYLSLWYGDKRYNWI